MTPDVASAMAAFTAAEERAEMEKGDDWWTGVRRRYRQLLLNRVVLRKYIKRDLKGSWRKGGMGESLAAII